MRYLKRIIRKATKPIRNNIKGFVGESAVAKKLSGFRYSVHDLLFNDGIKSVQIDHIVITRSGIHVIETKNYGGKIYGKPDSKTWYQYVGTKKSEFMNPVRQNQGHIWALQRVLGNRNDDLFHSYVVFTDKATIATELPIVALSEIKGKIEERSPFLSEDQVEGLYKKIMTIKKNNTITKRQHIKSVQKRMKNV